MFIRRREINGTAYFSVVETYRDDGKVCQRTVVSLGQFSTVEAAIEDCRWWGEQYLERSTLYGGRNGRYSVSINGGAYTFLPVGKEAKRRAEKLKANLSLLMNCRDVMAKTVIQDDTVYHYSEGEHRQP
jgi:hypothetical protein